MSVLIFFMLLPAAIVIVATRILATSSRKWLVHLVTSPWPLVPFIYVEVVVGGANDPGGGGFGLLYVLLVLCVSVIMYLKAVIVDAWSRRRHPAHS
jgi:hypothetical protein